MKKDEITRVRLLSLAVLMALSLFILLVPIGSNEFAQIISKMNNNALNIPESQNSVYNLYYYTGFNVVYQLFFSLTIPTYFVILSFISIYLYKYITFSTFFCILFIIDTCNINILYPIADKSLTFTISINSFYHI